MEPQKKSKVASSVLCLCSYKISLFTISLEKCLNGPDRKQMRKFWPTFLIKKHLFFGHTKKNWRKAGRKGGAGINLTVNYPLSFYDFHYKRNWIEISLNRQGRVRVYI